MPSQDPVDPDRQQPAAGTDAELPILVQPVARPDWPRVISTVRVLTGVQVALVMVFGNCSFGVPLAAAISWAIELLNLNEDASLGIPWAWAIGFAAIFTYSCFTIRWAGEADRRARTTVVIAMVVLATFTAITAAFAAWVWPGLIAVVLLTAAPSLIIQTIVLRCVFSDEARQWFTSSEAGRMDGSA